MDRRRFLRVSALAGVAGLAGCSGGDGSTPEATTTSTTATTTSTTATTTSTTPETTGTTTTATTATTTGETTTTTAETTATTATTTAEPRSSVTVTVGPGGNLRFDPETFALEVGGTVTWSWASGGHNVVPSSQPGSADWSGTADAPTKTYGKGHEYEYTFEVAGEYEYYCNPHRSFGMTGSFVVVEP